MNKKSNDPMYNYNRNHEWYLKNKERYLNAAENINGHSEQADRRDAKELCRRNANYICQICGEEGMDAHHIKPVDNETGVGDDSQENLICLCRSCHQKVDKGFYLLDENRQPSVNLSKYTAVDNILPYAAAYMKNHDVQLYYNTGLRYFYIKNFKYIQVPAEKMKAEYNFKTKGQLYEEDQQPKREFRAKIKILKEQAAECKASGDIEGWHELCKKIKQLKQNHKNIIV